MTKLQGLTAGNTSKSCIYCSLHHWHFQDAKVEYDLSKTRQEQSLSCVCNMSLDTWLCVKTNKGSCAWAALPARSGSGCRQPGMLKSHRWVSGTCLTCWRLSHPSPRPLWWKIFDILCSRLDSTLLSLHHTDKRWYLRDPTSWRCSHYHPHCFKFPVSYILSESSPARLCPKLCAPLASCFCQSGNILPQQAQLRSHQCLALL